MAVDLVAVSNAASELIDRYGANSIAMAEEHVTTAKRVGGGPTLTLALLVLSEVERLCQAEKPDAGKEIL